jgi:hypothetical protein
MVVGLLVIHEPGTGELSGEFNERKQTVTTTVVVICIVNRRSFVCTDMTKRGVCREPWATHRIISNTRTRHIQPNPFEDVHK